MLKPVGLRVSDGAGQLHFTSTEFAGPLKVIVALAGQVVSGTKMLTEVDWLAGSVPFGGLMVIPLIPLDVADQLRDC